MVSGGDVNLGRYWYKLSQYVPENGELVIERKSVIHRFIPIYKYHPSQGRLLSWSQQQPQINNRFRVTPHQNTSSRSMPSKKEKKNYTRAIFSRIRLQNTNTRQH